MSYSFSVVAPNKAAAIRAIAEEFDRVVTNCAEHAADRDAAQAAVTAFIEVLTDPGEHEVIAVSVSGYLSWRTEGRFSSGNFSVSATIGEALPEA